MTFFFRKYKSLSRGYFGSWGHSLVAIAVVERFKPVSMYGPSARDQKKKKKNDRCREVAVSGGSDRLCSGG